MLKSTKKQKHLMEMTKCLLLNSELADIYCDKVEITINFLQNGLPTK